MSVVLLAKLSIKMSECLDKMTIMLDIHNKFFNSDYNFTSTSSK